MKIREQDSCVPTYFRVGSSSHCCLGILDLHMSVEDDVKVSFQTYIVAIDVPRLLGLDVLHRLKLLVNFDNDTLLSPRDDWSIKLVSKVGHIYVEWPLEIFYTDSKIRRIHRPIYHPSTKTLMNNSLISIILSDQMAVDLSLSLIFDVALFSSALNPSVKTNIKSSSKELTVKYEKT